MTISFYDNKEIFNNKEYPIGTTFKSIYNQMSNLTYSNNFELTGYKNIEFLQYHQQVLTIMNFEKIMEICDIEFKNKKTIESIYDTEIEIEGIILEKQEFKELIFFIILLDEFIKLTLKDKRINNCSRFIFFFTTLNNYNIPKETIENKELIDIYTKELKNMNNDSKNYNNEEHYKEIFENDKKIFEKVKNDTKFIYKYECKDFIEILLVSYLYILKNDIHLKQCKNCKRFFIAKNDNQEYCDMIRPKKINESNEEYTRFRISCRKFNKQFPWKIEKDDVQDVERTVRLRIQKRIRNKKETKEYLDEWEKRIREYRKKHFNNEIYINWLKNESDIHQIRRRKNGSKRNNKK